MKKSKRAKLRAKLWKAVKEIVHTRGECELCGRSQGKLDCHHINGRSGQLLYCLDGCILLCFTCHRNGVHSPASTTQAEFRKKIIDKRGEIDWLMKLKDQKIGIVEMEELLEQYKAIGAL